MFTNTIIILLSFIKYSLILLTILFSETNANQYCDNGVCVHGQANNLCKNQSHGPASTCIDYKRMDDKDKPLILHKINERRNKVALGEIRSLPAAENMLKLDWSEDLAISAQRWADQCVEYNVPDLSDGCLDLENTPVGQNIATVYGDAPGLTAAALVDVWYTELLNLKPSIVSRYEMSTDINSHYDYFTQLVWANTQEVGCGGVVFKEYRGKNRTVHRLVCNFKPSGNKPGAKVYSDGIPCTHCQSSGVCDKEYPALCYTNSSVIRTTDSSLTITRGPSDSVRSLITTYPDFTDSNNEDLTLLDYFSNLYEFTKPSITLTTNKNASCKEILLVDELLELLKKKMGTDPLFKHILTTRNNVDQNENGFTDASIAVLMSQLHGINPTKTTTRTTINDYINSTLLANLVEAVIFKGADKYSTTEPVTPSADDNLQINPIKIQAELPQINKNVFFTGHYFFPEDEIDEEKTTELNDDIYDSTAKASVTDILLDLSDIQKNTMTKDFLLDILESEPNVESQLETKLNPSIVEINEENNHRNINKDEIINGENNNRNINKDDFTVENNFSVYEEEVIGT